MQRLACDEACVSPLESEMQNHGSYYSDSDMCDTDLVNHKPNHHNSNHSGCLPDPASAPALGSLSSSDNEKVTDVHPYAETGLLNCSPLFPTIPAPPQERPPSPKTRPPPPRTVPTLPRRPALASSTSMQPSPHSQRSACTNGNRSQTPRELCDPQGSFLIQSPTGSFRVAPISDLCLPVPSSPRLTDTQSTTLHSDSPTPPAMSPLLQQNNLNSAPSQTVSAPGVKSASNTAQSANNLPSVPEEALLSGGYYHEYSMFGAALHSPVYKPAKKGTMRWRILSIVLIVLLIVLVILTTYFAITGVRRSAATSPKVVGTGKHDDPSLQRLQTTHRPTPQALQASLYLPVKGVVPPKEFLYVSYTLAMASQLWINVSIPSDSRMALYGRKYSPPTHVEKGFSEAIDTSRHHDTPLRRKRSKPDDLIQVNVLKCLDGGLWYLGFYNDDRVSRDISVVSSKRKNSDTSNCASECNCHGSCEVTGGVGTCKCFPGYTGYSCADSVCPVVCAARGRYERGGCVCFKGWKGRECRTPIDQCIVPTCNGNGHCINGECVCFPGFHGESCAQKDCLHPNCSGHGVCVDTKCYCEKGYKGSDCSQSDIVDVKQLCMEDCSGHGTFSVASMQCTCQDGWSGKRCEDELCTLPCYHGHCRNGRCVCDHGWTGAECYQLACDPRCDKHGFCNNGTCECSRGWNGRHCTLDGCPEGCNMNGECRLLSGVWQCTCKSGWKGSSCKLHTEIQCRDGVDNNNNGLIDCQDPDCCFQTLQCQNDQLCSFSDEPNEVLLRKQAVKAMSSFYDHVSFLVDDKSIQNAASRERFESSSRRVSVIRGRVFLHDGTPLLGVKVKVRGEPFWGYTTTRTLGLFDLLVLGGGSLELRFSRPPLKDATTTVHVPWNQFLVLHESIFMYPTGNKAPLAPHCFVNHDYYRLRPTVFSMWKHTQVGSCVRRNAVLLEKQVLQSSIPLPGSDIKLMYHTSRQVGYKSTLLIELTPQHIPPDLFRILLKISVEGTILEREFEAEARLQYEFAWDRKNVYKQKVFGIAKAMVSVGYRYRDCIVPYWCHQMAEIAGFDVSPTNIGGWNLDVHHTYNFRDGILYRGDGTSKYLKERPKVVKVVMGTGKRRGDHCQSCDGEEPSSRMLASPIALASDVYGSIYIGDYNFVRKLSPDKDVTITILQLNLESAAYKYYMTVSPVNGKLYLTDYINKAVYKVVSMSKTGDLLGNKEKIAGAGSCTLGDPLHCGDGGPAVLARLLHPKGVAIDKDGSIFIADGTTIRVIGQSGKIQTFIGDLGQPRTLKAIPCDVPVSISDVTLQWPTSIAINPLDNTLYILDVDVVLRVTPDNFTMIIAGRPTHCPPFDTPSSLFGDSVSSLARYATLTSAVDMSFGPDGTLYIVETDKQINRIRAVISDGKIKHFVGSGYCAHCNTLNSRSVAAGTKLMNPTAVVVTPDNTVHFADQGLLKVFSVHSFTAKLNRKRQFEVTSPNGQEKYIFSRHGFHMHTVDLVTSLYKYNFTYSSSFLSVIQGQTSRLEIIYDVSMVPRQLALPQNRLVKLQIKPGISELRSLADGSGILSAFSYIPDSGLLSSKQLHTGEWSSYTYSKNGRIVSTIQPTGVITHVSASVDPLYGAVMKSTQKDATSSEVFATPETISVTGGNQNVLISHTETSGVRMEWANRTFAVGLYLSPHPSLSSQTSLKLTRNILCLDASKNTIEWRYSVKSGWRARRGISGLLHRRRNRHSRAPKFGLTYITLQVNGEIPLTFEYDRLRRVEAVANGDKQILLNITYNDAGQPTEYLPVLDNKLVPLSIKYNSNGQRMMQERGASSIHQEYDIWQYQSGSLVGRISGAHEKYKYVRSKNNFIKKITVGSESAYQFEYDSHGGLLSLQMPLGSVHRFSSYSAIGFSRLLYYPPSVETPFMQDTDSAGKLLRVFYPSGLRQVTHQNLNVTSSAILFDKMSVISSTVADKRVLSVNDHGGVSSMLFYKPTAGPISQQGVRYFGTNALFTYSYNSFLRVAKTDARVNGVQLDPVVNSYHPTKGYLSQVAKFTISQQNLPERKWVLSANDLEIVTTIDEFGRKSGSSYRIAGDKVFESLYTYDNFHRISSYKSRWSSHLALSTEGFRRDDFTYDVDGNIVEVSKDGPTAFRFQYDENSNLVSIVRGKIGQILLVNKANQMISFANVNFTYDLDGFLVKRGNEIFEYNSLCQLTKVFHPGKWERWYHYDAVGRLISIKDNTGHLQQFFYGDLLKQWRVTHTLVTRGKRQTTSEYYYNMHGELFAVKQLNTFWYVVCNHDNTPHLVYNSEGTLVKSIEYTPYGAPENDSNVDMYLPFGFQHGISDSLVGLAFIKGRPYDPTIGRWINPDFAGFVRNIGRAYEWPISANLYQYKSIKSISGKRESMTYIQSWLRLYGYDIQTLIPSVSMSGRVNEQGQEWADCSGATQLRTLSSLQCGIQSELDNFQQLPTVPGAVSQVPEETLRVAVTSALSKHLLVSNQNGRAVVNLMPGADDDESVLADVILNHTRFLLDDIATITNGTQEIFLLKDAGFDLHNEAASIELQPGGAETRVAGLKVSVAETGTVRISSEHLVINVRYGAAFDAERLRLLRSIKERTVALAWSAEQQLLVRSGRGSRAWTRSEVRQILRTGKCEGYSGVFVRGSDISPQLLTHPANVRFTKSQSSSIDDFWDKN